MSTQSAKSYSKRLLDLYLAALTAGWLGITPNKAPRSALPAELRGAYEGCNEKIALAGAFAVVMLAAVLAAGCTFPTTSSPTPSASTATLRF